MGEVNLSSSAVSLVREVKAAINSADAQLRQNDLKITEVDLELRTVVETTAGGGVTIGVLEVGGDRTRDDTNTLSLRLTPSTAGVQLMASPAEDLVAAILATSAASLAAADSPPAFILVDATVTIEVEVNLSGKVSLIARGGAAHTKGHTLTLTLSPL